MTMARKIYLLRPATENELRELRIQHKAVWGNGLTTEQYLVREELLASTPLTANGGIQHWVLVDPTVTPNRVLASCETIRKDVFTASANSRRVDKESGYVVGSVFTPPEMRWNGYARILLKMMADMLMDLDGDNELSVLYSDIGKEFYSRLGWTPHRAEHLAIPCNTPASLAIAPPQSIRLLTATDIAPLCERDIDNLERSLAKPTPKHRFAFSPDHNTMRWHHAREEFVAPIYGRTPPPFKGALSTTRKSWMIWTHHFAQRDTKLYVLRIASDEEEIGDLEVEELLRAAVHEAAKYRLATVEIWNPNEKVARLGAAFGGKMVSREMDSIPSLMRYEAGGSDPETVEWVANEKYGWC